MNRHTPHLLGAGVLAVLAGCAGAPAPTAEQAREPAPAPPSLPTYAGIPVLRDSPAADMAFQRFGVNPTIETREQALTTFAADAGSASYTMARGFLGAGYLPPEAAVRTEDFINRFDYRYEAPVEAPLSLWAEVVPSPSRPGFSVLHLGIKAREIGAEPRHPVCLALAIEVSHSMARGARLEQVKAAVDRLLGRLDPEDSVSVVALAESAKTLLAPTPASERRLILGAVSGLEPGGAARLEDGLGTAYRILEEQTSSCARKRVLLLADGFSLVGAEELASLQARVAEQAARGVSLSALGFGLGQYDDALMRSLADRGEGFYAYVDRIEEAGRALDRRLIGKLEIVAGDLKVQLELNPEVVARYRLLGYEGRRLAARELGDADIGGGELGLGESVTVLVEMRLKGPGEPLGRLSVSYRAPAGAPAQRLERSLPWRIVHGPSAGPPESTLALAAALFAEKLRGSYWARSVEYGYLAGLIDSLPQTIAGGPEVLELRSLIERARDLDSRPDKFERVHPAAEMSFDHLPVLR